MKLLPTLFLLTICCLFTINATICDYDDCTCSEATVSCRCEKSDYFEPAGNYSKIPFVINKFSVEQCDTVVISTGMFDSTNVTSIIIRDSGEVFVHQRAIFWFAPRMSSLLFSNVTLNLEWGAIQKQIKSVVFQSVRFSPFFDNVGAVSVDLGSIKFEDCDISTLSMLHYHSQAKNVVISNSRIKEIATRNLAVYIENSVKISNSYIGTIKTYGVLPPNWGSRNILVNDVTFLNNTIGVLEKDFFYALTNTILNFTFVDNNVSIANRGAFGPSLSNCVGSVVIQNNTINNTYISYF